MEVNATRWSAEIQYVSAEKRIDHFLSNVESGWGMWCMQLRRDQKQQQQQQIKAAANAGEPTPESPVEQQGCKPLFLGVYQDHLDWFTAEVLPGLESEPHLMGLQALLSKWRNPHRLQAVRTCLHLLPMGLLTWRLSAGRLIVHFATTASVIIFLAVKVMP